MLLPLMASAHRRAEASPAVFSLGNKKPRLVSIHAESTGVTGVFDMRPVLEGSGRDADPFQRQLLGPSVLANRRGAASPANDVVAIHDPWLWVEMRRDSRGNGGLGSGGLLDG